jgi:hypothetical protein
MKTLTTKIIKDDIYIIVDVLNIFINIVHRGDHIRIFYL